MSQRLVRCIEGHVYDEAVNEACPICGSKRSVSAPPTQTEVSEAIEKSAEPVVEPHKGPATPALDVRLYLAGGGVAAVVLAVGVWALLGLRSVPRPAASQAQAPTESHDRSNARPPSQAVAPKDAASSAQATTGADFAATDCDRYAMSPLDQDRVAGVDGINQTGDIDVAVAVPACEKAVQASPNARRLWSDLGRAYRAAKNDKAAADAYRHAADEGSVFGAYALGVLLRDGAGVQQDGAEARRYMRIAADANLPVAMLEYANMLDAGVGGSQNQTEAKHWYEQAAKGGNTTAMNWLGIYLVDGTAGPKDFAKARDLFQSAAAKGDSMGLVNLGFLAENGIDGPKDLQAAQKRYEQAANAGDTLAMRQLAEMVLNGETSTLQLDDARKWLEQAANRGDASAMTKLGFAYMNGSFGANDLLSARHWFESAAADGDAAAMNEMGRFYHNAMGVPRDYQAARDWYTKAVQRGNVQALANIGVLFEFGEGVPQNFAEAWRLFDQAAGKGNAFAVMHLGQMAEYGKGMAIDLNQARDLYVKALDLGSVDAGWRLALLLDHHATNKDPTAIAKLALNALKDGSTDAREALLSGSERGLSREVIAAIQTELGNAGVYSGPIHGRLDHSVRDALIEYIKGAADQRADAPTKPITIP